MWESYRPLSKLPARQLQNGKRIMLDTFDAEIDKFFRDAFPDFYKSLSISDLGSASFPKVNVWETKHPQSPMVVVEAAIAGYRKNDVDITFSPESRTLTISGKHVLTQEDKDEASMAKPYIINEIKRSKFSRSFTLSEHLDADNIEASFEDGVLTVKIPKIEVSEESVEKVRKVPIV